MEQGRIKPATLAAQALHYVDPVTGGLVPPIQPSTTFARDAGLRADQSGPHLRPRRHSGLPAGRGRAVRARRRRRGAGLPLGHGGDRGAVPHASARRGGRRATADLLRHARLAREVLRAAGDRAAAFRRRRSTSLERAVQDAKPAIVWIETPSNPMLDVVDIAHAAKIAHAAGALLAVDGTAATPILTRPLALGADLVMHSATKYLNGHSDVLAGVLVTARADERWAAIRADRHDAGALLGPFEAWLLLRGLRTLALRVRRPAQTHSRSRNSWRATRGRAGALPGPAEPSAARVGAAADDRRLRRPLVVPGQGRRSGGARGRRPAPADRARDLARRHREPDRARLTIEGAATGVPPNCSASPPASRTPTTSSPTSPRRSMARVEGTQGKVYEKDEQHYTFSGLVERWAAIGLARLQPPF